MPGVPDCNGLRAVRPAILRGSAALPTALAPALVLPLALIVAPILPLSLTAAGPAAAQAPAPAPRPAPGTGPATGTVQVPVAGLAQAQALIRAGRFIEALRLLRPLVRGGAVHAGALFNLGLAAMGASQTPGLPDEVRLGLLNEAIQAFRRMLIDRPDLVRVRLELARAFFLKGDDDLARRHFEHVLAGRPPQPIANNVRFFLAQIRARRRWTTHSGIALAPDSNLGAESDARTIYLFGLPFRRDRSELTSSGVGVVVWGGGEYQYPMSQHMRLRAGANFNRREHKGIRFDRMTVSGHLGPRWLLGPSAEASVLSSARQHWVAGAPSHRDLGFRLETSRRVGRQVTVQAQTAWHHRLYRDRASLNGPLLDVTLGAVWAATPTVRLDGGVDWGRELPRTASQRLTRRRVRANVSIALPLGFTAGFGGALQWTNYRGNWFPYTLDASARRDRTWTLRLSVFNRSVTLGGFSPQLSLVREVRRTNAQLFDYSRTSGEIRLVQLF